MATTAQQSIPTKAAAAAYDYEVIVIGAGVSGIYQIKRLVDLGVRATVLDANSDVGGTWYNNRYPGARFDSESYTYGYSFSKELLNEWDWTERFSPQPETLRYLNFVVDKLKLREHMQFGCRIDAMHFDEQTDTWRLTLSDGRTLSSRGGGHRHRPAVHPNAAENSGHGRLQRDFIPHRQLAACCARSHR